MIRIAFVKYAGLAAGGTERWLQTIAANLPRDEYVVDYFYADAVPYVASAEVVPGTDPSRRRWMEERGVTLIEFHVGAVDDRFAEKRWLHTDFWDVFDAGRYDFVQTAKEGLPEYPYCRLRLPVFEQVSYTAGVDSSANTIRSGFHSQWHRSWWARRGGDVGRSFVTPIPVTPPVVNDDLREELGISPRDLVVGFHQRPSDGSFSPVQLAALGRLGRKDVHLVVLGGSTLYRDQATRMGIPAHFLAATADGAAISRFLNTLDVFIHGRRDGETFGTVLAEALVHGLPCISHRVRRGGNAQHETIGPGGVVVDTVDDYRRMLEQLLCDGALRARLASKGEEHARSRYSVAAAVADMTQQYRAFMAGEPPVRGGGGMAPYGEEPGGLLVAGPIEEPGHPAHSVLTGRPARPLAARIIRSEATSRTVLEVGAGRAHLSFVAAGSGGRGHIVDLGCGQDSAALTVYLNGFEEKVTIRPDTESPDAGRHRFLSVTDEPAAAAWLERVRHLLGADAPLVLLGSRAPRALRRSLRVAGYRRAGFAGEQVYVHRSVPDRTHGMRLWSAAATTELVTHVRSMGDAVVRGLEPPRARMRGPVKAYAGILRARLSRRSRS